MIFKIIVSKNRGAVHGEFSDLERAKNHLNTVVPVYIDRGIFMDKDLRVGDFEIIDSNGLTVAKYGD